MVERHHQLNGRELSKLREIVEDRGTWRAPVHGVAKSRTQLELLNSNKNQSKMQTICSMFYVGETIP